MCDKSCGTLHLVIVCIKDGGEVIPNSSSKPFKPTQVLFLNEEDVKTLWQILLGNPAISSFVGCFKATLINAGMPEMISVMRNQKPLSHCSVNIQNFELWFIALLKQGLDLGNMICLSICFKAGSKICPCCWWRLGLILWTKVLSFILLCWFKVLTLTIWFILSCWFRALTKTFWIYYKFCW